MTRVWPLLALMALLAAQPTPASAHVTVKVKEQSSAKVKDVVELRHNSQAAALVPGGKTLVAASEQGEVVLVDVTTGNETARFRAHQDEVTCVAVSADGKTLATASGKVLKVWELTTRKQLLVLRSDEGTEALAVSADGKTVASMHGRRERRMKVHAFVRPEVRVWCVTTGKERAQLLPARDIGQLAGIDNGPPWPGMLTFSPNGKFIAARWPVADVTIWDAETGHELKWDKRDDGLSDGVAFSPDSKLLALNHDGIRLIAVPSGKAQKGAFEMEEQVLAFSPDGKVLVVRANDGFELLAADTGKSLATLKGAPVSGATVLFSADGKTLTALTLEGGLKSWELTWEKAPAK